MNQLPQSPAQQFASHLLAGFVAAGVDQIFLAPGARSQALAIAAQQLAAADKADLYVRIDERSLGFTALGASLASGKPSIIITTSGTAVANLHPAVLEAHHSGVPLILLTADRPEELRGVGANQTTKQVGIFDEAVRAVIDVDAPTHEDWGLAKTIDLVQSAVTLALGTGELRPGPVQLNLAFREPLSSADVDTSKIELPPIEITLKKPEPDFAILDGSVATVVIAGAGAGEAAVELAEAFGLPLFAEPSSQARFGENAILAYSNILATDPMLPDQIGRAIVFGKPTLTRPIISLLNNPTVEVVVIKSRTMGHFDVSRRASLFVDEVTMNAEGPDGWLELWRVADQLEAVDAPVEDAEISREDIIAKVWQAIEPGDQLVLGASRMIREADRWAPAKNIAVYSNRGLAGIDGTVSTATGIALATRSRTRVVLGDLTLLHDVGALAIDPKDGPLDLQLIVANDHGGSIFEKLEPAKILSHDNFERVFRTPQLVYFEPLAKAFDWQYAKVTNVRELEGALQIRGRVLIEVELAESPYNGLKL